MTKQGVCISMVAVKAMTPTRTRSVVGPVEVEPALTGVSAMSSHPLVSRAIVRPAKVGTEMKNHTASAVFLLLSR